MTFLTCDCCTMFDLFFSYCIGTNFAAGISSWYREYCAWNFGVLDLVVTGGADRYLAALMESDSVRNLDFT